MSEKWLMSCAAAAYVLTSITPLTAQQSPAPAQSNPSASQPAPPSDPTTPPVGRTPVIPRRIPAPTQPPGFLGSQPGTTQAQTPTPVAAPQPDPPQLLQPLPGAAERAAPPTAPQPPLPPRRLSQPPSIPSGGMVSLNFNRADLVEIIHIIAQQLRLTYTIDPEVKGTVTINSAEPLRAEDLLPIFHQLLRMNGAVAVRTGNLYHIMPIKDGKGLARPVGQNREDSFALQIIPVRFFSVSEMKKVLTPFLQPGAEIIDNPRGNFLVVMDIPANIQRLVEIADLIDVQVFAGTRMEIYQPKIASAEELAVEMTKVMQSFAASTPQTDTFTAQFIPLPRINQLLVISHSEAAWTYTKRWLDRIDVVAQGPGRRIFIYPVENGKATDLADVLNQALGQASSGGRSNYQTLQNLHRSIAWDGGRPIWQLRPIWRLRTIRHKRSVRSGIQSGSGADTMKICTAVMVIWFGGAALAEAQSQNPSGAFATVPVPGQVQPPAIVAPQRRSRRLRAWPGQQVKRNRRSSKEQLRIVADPATNSLIVYGTAQEYQNMKNILKDLDAIPRQVLLEVMVAEMTLSDSVDSASITRLRKNFPSSIFGQKFGSAGAIQNIRRAISNHTIRSAGGVSGIFGRQGHQSIINALQSDARIRVLSSPSVIARDNRPARIQVGTRSLSQPGHFRRQLAVAAQSATTTIQYRNTGRIVTIIPQVNSQGLVNLQIQAEVSQDGEKTSKWGRIRSPLLTLKTRKPRQWFKTVRL